MTKTRKSSLVLFSIVSVVSIFFSQTASAGNSASTSALAKAKVIKSIAIVKVNDLDFGTAFSSDPAITIAPGAAGSASFTVTGEKNTAYTITLPSSVTMANTTTGGSTPDDQIDVNTFASNPNGTGLLSNAGSQTLSVGATRAAIRATQNSGDYSASFTVQVVY